MYNQTHLLTFLTVLQTNSFAGAAAELGYTASAVSQQIASLESSIGLRLFDRGPRQIRPTSAALVLAERSRDLMAEFKALQESIIDIATGRNGRIRIGTVPSASARILPNALNRFVSDHIGAEILLEEDPTPGLASGLLRGDFDVIVIAEHGNVNTPFGAEFVSTSLVKDHMLLLVSNDRPDGKTPASGVAAFADDLWAAPKMGQAGSSYFEQLCALAGFIPRVRYRSANFGVLSELVRVGVAVALVPVLGYSENHEVSAGLLTGVHSKRRLRAVYRAANSNPLMPPLLDALRFAGNEAQQEIDRIISGLPSIDPGGEAR